MKIIENNFLRLFALVALLNVTQRLEFLQNNLANLVEYGTNMLFMHDGVPPHCTRISNQYISESVDRPTGNIVGRCR